MKKQMFFPFKNEKYHIVGEVQFNKHSKGLIGVEGNGDISLILCTTSREPIEKILIYQSENSFCTSSILSNDKILVTTKKYLLFGNNRIMNDFSQNVIVPPSLQ